MKIDLQNVDKEDVEQFEKNCSNFIWRYYWTKNNYPNNHFTQDICMQDFPNEKIFFYVYVGDKRKPLNIKEYYLFLMLNALSPNIYLTYKTNYITFSREKNAHFFHRIFHNLEKKKYIISKPNYKSIFDLRKKRWHKDGDKFHAGARITVHTLNQFYEKDNLHEINKKRKYKKLLAKNNQEIPQHLQFLKFDIKEMVR